MSERLRGSFRKGKTRESYRPPSPPAEETTSLPSSFHIDQSSSELRFDQSISNSSAFDKLAEMVAGAQAQPVVEQDDTEDYRHLTQLIQSPRYEVEFVAGHKVYSLENGVILSFPIDDMGNTGDADVAAIIEKLLSI